MKNNYCPQCGRKIGEDEIFCQNCGFNVDGVPGSLYDNLLEFNELNNLEPIPVSY